MSAQSGEIAPRGRGGGRLIRGLDADQRRAQRREQLLGAALELFARDGYVHTSIEQICQTAYVGTKAFYELFESKEDCHLALLRQSAERIEQQVAHALAQTSADETGPQLVRRMVTAFTHALIDDPRVAVVGFRESPGISPRIEAQRQANRRWAVSFIEAYWHGNRPAASDSGSDGKAGTNYRALAVATVGGLFESISDFLTPSESPRSVDELIEDMTTFVLAVEAATR